MVVEQTVAVELERLALFKIVECLKKCLKVSLFAKDLLPIILAIDFVINQTIFDRS